MARLRLFLPSLLHPPPAVPAAPTSAATPVASLPPEPPSSPPLKVRSASRRGSRRRRRRPAPLLLARSGVLLPPAAPAPSSGRCRAPLSLSMLPTMAPASGISTHRRRPLCLVLSPRWPSDFVVGTRGDAEGASHPFSVVSVLTSRFSAPEDCFSVVSYGRGVFSFTVACRTVASSVLRPTDSSTTASGSPSSWPLRRRDNMCFFSKCCRPSGSPG